MAEVSSPPIERQALSVLVASGISGDWPDLQCFFCDGTISSFFFGGGGSFLLGLNVWKEFFLSVGLFLPGAGFVDLIDQVVQDFLDVLEKLGPEKAKNTGGYFYGRTIEFHA